MLPVFSVEFFFENNIDSFKPWMQKIIYIKVDDVPSPAPKNNQENVRYFDDYSIDNILCVETLHEEPKSEDMVKIKSRPQTS